jgi:hypothetical protein
LFEADEGRMERMDATMNFIAGKASGSIDGSSRFVVLNV